MRLSTVLYIAFGFNTGSAGLTKRYTIKDKSLKTSSFKRSTDTKKKILYVQEIIAFWILYKYKI